MTAHHPIHPSLAAHPLQTFLYPAFRLVAGNESPGGLKKFFYRVQRILMSLRLPGAAGPETRLRELLSSLTCSAVL